MQNLFISENDQFKVTLAVATTKTGDIYCDINRELLEKSISGFLDIASCEIKDYEVVLKKPSFGDTMSLYDQIFSVTSSASVNFNPILSRFKKIALLVKEWNLTEDGSFKKPSEEEIRSLHPLIANAIGIQIDSETGGIIG